MPPKIAQFEIDRYWEIFASLLPPGAQHLDGASAASVLKNSRLSDTQLERVWDLADVDNDGRLDFEEFCVAMRLIFDVVNGEIPDVPAQIPDWLVPESKAHLVAANRSVKTGHVRAPELDSTEDDEVDGSGRRLQDGFDWYMAPGQKREYEDIYSSAKDAHGYVSFSSLSELYDSLEVPDTDVRSAWNLVNPAADEVIGHEAAIAFLHVLRGRHEGFRVPRTVPASLRATFEPGKIEYSVDRVKMEAERKLADDSTSTGRKAKFGDSYLGRLGGGSDRKGAARSKGTDFSATGGLSEDWEEVRLKKQLRELEARIERVEEIGRKREASGRRSDSKPALIKRELEQLLDYKRRQLRDLETGEGGAREGKNMRGVEEDISTIKEQLDGLEQHLARRKEALEGLKRQVQQERGR